ncbi:MAG: methionine--tRNA ligase [Oscillospiraceae bacterium]|nr:methionine--tRNA ligase [Oscillospiraceae bacterium]
MSKSKGKYYITTAIAYTSRKPHIGNSYEIVLTDAIARYKRLQGYDVFMCTGTDEHGQKIEEYAEKSNVSPKEYVDKVAGEIKNICDILNTTYDHFIRTTDDYHEKAVQKIFKKLYEKGDIYKSEYEGLYCTPCESFWTETQLVDGKCPDCGREVKKTKEEAYFFAMSKYQKQLEDYIESNPDFIYPESRKKEMLNNFIKPGIQDLCVSRTSFKWGIPVDFDDKHVIYVWIDALSNYITALGYDTENPSEKYKKYWPANVHIIGKDILRFHTIYWPCMLMALGEPLPKQVFGHPWLLFGTDKMSKSRGNVIYADDLVNLLGVDPVRYYLLSEMPYAQDGSITYETIIERYNSDLANTLGNLVKRTIDMTAKYFDSKVTLFDSELNEEDIDKDLKECAVNTVAKVDKLMDTFRVSDALNEILNLARRSNKYIDETSPWVLAKSEENKPRLATVLYNLLESIRYIAVLIQPFMPDTSKAILNQLNTSVSDYESLETFGGLKAGTILNKSVALFQRIDAEKMLAEIEAKADETVEKNQESKEKIELNPEIAIDDFMKVELRVAKIISCEKVKKSKKLLCLQLDDGMGGRQVVSGIAEYYKPEDLIGKKVQIVANLKPVKLCGVESNGMICACDTPEGVKVIFIDDDVPAGSKIR